MIEMDNYIIRHHAEDLSDNNITISAIELPEMSCDVTPFYRIEGREIFPFTVTFDRKDLTTDGSY